MNNISLVGNNFQDSFHIMNNKKYFNMERKGGIFNMWDCFDKNICLLDLHLTDDINYCTIVKNHFGESSSVQWSQSDYNNLELSKPIKNIDWIHFSYLNTIKNLNLGDGRFGTTKSCDFTVDGRPEVSVYDAYSNAKYCHLIFVSNTTNYELFKRLKDWDTGSNYLIVHEPKGSTIYDGKREEKCSYSHPKENFAITIGSGDRFAGYFINAYKNLGYSLELSQVYAHQKVLEWLRRENKQYE